MHNLLTCLDATPNLLGILDTSIAPTLLFYSYIPVAIISLIFALFVFKGSKRSLSGKLILSISLLFFLWTLSAIFTWITVQAGVVHFFWQVIAIIEVLIYLCSFYFVYVFLNKDDLPFLGKIILYGASLPVIITLPTKLNMLSFDLVNCQSNNGNIWGYIYILEITITVFIGWMCLKKFFDKTADSVLRKESLLLMFGSVLFLGIFTTTNVIGDSTFFYQVNLLGPIGMVAFLGLLTFMIVRFKALNIKLLATQALVWAVVILIGSQFFFIQSDVNKILNSFTLIAASVLSLIIVRSVKKEIESRERIQKLADELEIAGEAQAETLRFITHQVKGVFTNTKGALSSILEGDYDPITESLRKMVQNLFVIQNGGVDSVQAFLSASQLENGNPYVMKDVNLKNIVSEACIQLKMKAEKKGLVFETSIPEGESYKMMGDGVYLSNAILNIINNAVCYTKTGSIHVALSKTEDKFALFSVKDTGVGITQEDGQQLFTKYGHGKDSRLINVDSNGLGLYLVKKIIDAHQGTVWYESEVGEGTTFFVKLPLA